VVLGLEYGGLVPKVTDIIVGKEYGGDLLDDGKEAVKRSYSAEAGERRWGGKGGGPRPTRRRPLRQRWAVLAEKAAKPGHDRGG
jgi:hypothetical protein